MPSSESRNTPTGAYRGRNTARTKREILDVAGRKFARFGFSHVSLKMISDEVGITPAMINHHFGSKRGLFAAVARDEWGWEEEVNTQESLDDIRELARKTVEYWCDSDARSPSIALLRSLDQPATTELFCSELKRRIANPWMKDLTGPHTELRAQIAVGLSMGIGLFTTGALLDPDAPPLSEQDRGVLIDYVERFLTIVHEG